MERGGGQYDYVLICSDVWAVTLTETPVVSAKVTSHLGILMYNVEPATL
jgi:hypothetical protein